MVSPLARAALDRFEHAKHAYAERRGAAAMRPTGGATPMEGRRPAARPAAAMRPVGGAATAVRGIPTRRFNPAARRLNGAQIGEYVRTLRVMTREGGYVRPDIARWLEKEGYAKRSGRGWKAAGRGAETQLIRKLARTP